MCSNFRCQSSIWRFKTILNFPILRHSIIADCDSFSAVCSMITFNYHCLIEDVLTGITKCSEPGPSIVWGFVLVALYPQLFPSLLGAQDYQSLCEQYGLNTTIFGGDMLQQSWVLPGWIRLWGEMSSVFAGYLNFSLGKKYILKIICIIGIQTL